MPTGMTTKLSYHQSIGFNRFLVNPTAEASVEENFLNFNLLITPLNEPEDYNRNSTTNGDHGDHPSYEWYLTGLELHPLKEKYGKRMRK